jgi:phosphohistidine phosphatase
MLSVEREKPYRELLLLRHAKSDQGLGLPDFDRPLNRRGRDAAGRMGHWLRSEMTEPGLILCSPAQRTRETCRLLLNAMGCPGQVVQWQSEIYEARRQDLLSLLATCPASARRVLLIGHNPGLEDVLLWLVDMADEAKLLPTAAMAWIEIPVDWDRLVPQCGRLKQLLYPRNLPA